MLWPLHEFKQDCRFVLANGLIGFGEATLVSC